MSAYGYNTFLGKTLLRYPGKLPLAMRLAIKGYDHERHTREVVLALSSFREESTKLFFGYKEFVADVVAHLQDGWVEKIKERTVVVLREVRSHAHELRECREAAHAHLDIFRSDVRNYVRQATESLLLFHEHTIADIDHLSQRTKDIVSLNSQIEMLCDV